MSTLRHEVLPLWPCSELFVKLEAFQIWKRIPHRYLPTSCQHTVVGVSAQIAVIPITVFTLSGGSLAVSLCCVTLLALFPHWPIKFHFPGIWYWEKNYDWDRAGKWKKSFRNRGLPILYYHLHGEVGVKRQAEKTDGKPFFWFLV